MSRSETDSSKTATYYNDQNVARFYEICWGGSDIHIGLYATGNETISEASALMTNHLVQQAGISPGQRVLDIACGYGGTLRKLARLGCHVKGIDISISCIERTLEANAAAGFEDLIEVELGDFHSINSEPNYWDAAICQESLIHSNNRPKVFAEVYRILRQDGVFVFSDILTGKDANVSIVQRAFDRLGAKAGATVSDYQNMAVETGFQIVHMEERHGDIKTHYKKLAEKLDNPIQGLSSGARESIAQNITNWQSALADHHITWACFVARKPLR